MTASRAGSGVVALPDGEGLFAGGLVGDAPLGAADVGLDADGPVGLAALPWGWLSFCAQPTTRAEQAHARSPRRVSGVG